MELRFLLSNGITAVLEARKQAGNAFPHPRFTQEQANKDAPGLTLCCTTWHTALKRQKKCYELRKINREVKII